MPRTALPDPQICAMPEGWIIADDASKILDIDMTTLRTLVHSQKLVKGYLGSSLCVTRESVEAYKSTRGGPQGGRPKGKKSKIKDIS